MFFCIGCGSLPISEPATNAYANSLKEKAKAIKEKPGVSKEEILTANELERAANLIQISGKQSAENQEEIQDLNYKAGQIDFLYWIASFLIIGALIYFIGPILLKRFG
jgi:TATA-box binding protein (TBP) (component of TFIID and TFIIIB)